jgi:hypothetical protein
MGFNVSSLKRWRVKKRDRSNDAMRAHGLTPWPSAASTLLVVQVPWECSTVSGE